MENKINIELDNVPAQLVRDYTSNPSNYQAKIYSYLVQVHQDESEEKETDRRIAEGLDDVKNGRYRVLNDQYKEDMKKKISEKLFSK